jgi:hypothetical protein
MTLMTRLKEIRADEELAAPVPEAHDAGAPHASR